jgi:hypothetical protein
VNIEGVERPSRRAEARTARYPCAPACLMSPCPLPAPSPQPLPCTGRGPACLIPGHAVLCFFGGRGGRFLIFILVDADATYPNGMTFCYVIYAIRKLMCFVPILTDSDLG